MLLQVYHWNFFKKEYNDMMNEITRSLMEIVNEIKRCKI